MTLQKISAAGAFVVVTALLSAPAHAYRPPARVLLGKAMERQVERGVKTLRVELETQQFEMSGAPRGLAASERWMFQAPSSVRKESDAGDGARVEIRVDDKVVIKVAGADAKITKAPVDLLIDQLTAAPPLDDEHAAERMLRDLRLLGVNPEVVSFARFDGRIAYLIGSKPWENDKPQVWLDKDTLLLVRVVMVTTTPATTGAPAVVHRTDVRYLGWGSPLGGNWFPSSIEVWSDDKIVKRSLVRTVDKGMSFDASTFALR